MKRPDVALIVAAAVAVTACQQPADEANIAIDNVVNADAANAEIETLPPSEEGGAPDPSDTAAAPINEAEDDSENSPSTAVIPAQYRGRWGLNTNDCDPRRSDNKGLMTIGEQRIRFYETTAALQEQRPAIATSFSGTFSFSGEGQAWERVITLTRTGDKLKRAQADANYIYTRCA